MSHEITRIDGTDCYAYRASKGAAWHRLGQEIADDAPTPVFFDAAGYDFTVQQSKVRYATDREGTLAEAPGLLVNLHSRTKACLGVVSDRYVRHQPKQVADFFDATFRLLGVRADSAGVLFDGRCLFASADMGESRVVGSDTIRANLLLTTWLDGTGATERRNVATRGVCANTVAAARAESKNGMYRKVSHRQDFDAEALAQGCADYVAAQHALVERCRVLAQAPVQLETAGDIVAALLAGKRAATAAPKADTQRVRTIRGAAGWNKIMALFNGEGRGADMPGVRGTLWGLHNAITEYTTHHARAASASHRMLSVVEGEGAKLNETALDLLEGIARGADDALAIADHGAMVA